MKAHYPDVYLVNKVLKNVEIKYTSSGLDLTTLTTAWKNFLMGGGGAPAFAL